MLYADTFERSRDLLKLAIPLMSRQTAALHPISYAVWYEYVAGTNDALTREIEALTSDGKRLDERETLRLYTTHVAGFDPGHAERLQARFEEILQRVNLSAAEMGRRADEYGIELADWGNELAAAASVDQAQAGLQRVLDRTRGIQSAVHVLSRKLEESRQESEQLREELTRSQEASLTDALTNLTNRRGLDLVLAECARKAASEGGELSVAMADLDRFKSVNDTYGHPVGDRLLTKVGQTLKANVKGRDTVARFGGEEFVIVMPDTPLDGAKALAEQIRVSIAHIQLALGEGEDSVGNFTVSIGVTRLHAGESADALLARADEALYVSKRRGRNCVTVLQ